MGPACLFIIPIVIARAFSAHAHVRVIRPNMVQRSWNSLPDGPMTNKSPRKVEIELHSDAWDRFRQAVHVMTKAGPQHRIGGVAVKDGPKHREKPARLKKKVV
jgi:hypothetical protein